MIENALGMILAGIATMRFLKKIPFNWIDVFLLSSSSTLLFVRF